MAILEEPMSPSVSIAEARDQLPRLVHEAEAGTPVQITRRGRPVAVLLSTAAYERLASRPTSLWQGIRELRAACSAELSGADDPFDDVRDPSPGREVEL